jgi:hypothetical protein
MGKHVHHAQAALPAGAIAAAHAQQPESSQIERVEVTVTRSASAVGYIRNRANGATAAGLHVKARF